MTNSKLGVVAYWAWLPLLVIVLILLAMLRGLRRETQTLRAATEAADRQASALMAQLSDQKARAAEGTAANASAIPNETTPKKPPPGALQSYSDSNVMSDPEFGPPVVRRQRRYAMGNYRQTIEAMHLLRADEDKLRQLVVARWNAGVDASDIVTRMGDDAAGLRLKAIAAAAAEGNRAIKEFVGEGPYKKFEAVFELSFNKTTNWMLFTALWDAGLPMTPDQKDSYARSLQQVNAQFSEAASRGTVDPETGLTQADLAVLQAAGSFLSPEQVAFIRNEKILDARFNTLGRAKASLKQGH
jgi:hypothetical protein